VRDIAPTSGDLAGGSRFNLRARPGSGVPGAALPETGLSLQIAPPGIHQVANASVAVLAALALPGAAVTSVQIARGLERWRWPGRMERPRSDLPLVFDCGHNREGGRSLAAALRRGFPGRPIELVAGMVDKKDHAAFFREMRRVAGHVWLSPPSTPRAASREALEAAAREAGLAVRPVASIAEGLREALARAHPGGPLAVLAGSLFTLEEGYRALGTAPAELLWPAGGEPDASRSTLHACG
jgi:dihydrofolate synthase/folylpolyglutamate synthase